MLKNSYPLSLIEYMAFLSTSFLLSSANQLLLLYFSLSNFGWHESLALVGYSFSGFQFQIPQQ